MYDRPVLRDPEKVVAQADLLLIESTDGNRSHRPLPETEDEISTPSSALAPPTAT